MSICLPYLLWQFIANHPFQRKKLVRVNQHAKRQVKKEIIKDPCIDESPAYVVKINGDHLFQQIDITPEEILRVQQFAQNKPFVQKIIVNNLTNILDLT